MKRLGVFLILIFAIIFSRNYWFNTFFRYDIVGERKVSEMKSSDLKENFKGKRKRDIEGIIQSALEETSSDLSFTFSQCESEPDKLIKTKKANCVGYSAFLSALIQDMINSKGINEWKVSHKVGKIYFLDENINRHFSSKFFQDHDFVTIENVKTKEIIAIDGTLYDYFRIDKIKLK